MPELRERRIDVAACLHGIDPESSGNRLGNCRLAATAIAELPDIARHARETVRAARVCVVQDRAARIGGDRERRLSRVIDAGHQPRIRCHGRNGMTLTDFLAARLRAQPSLGRALTRLLRQAFPQSVIALEYPVDERPRWTEERPNPYLHEVIARHRAAYAECLQSMLPFTGDFQRIAARSSPAHRPEEPVWINGWLPALDSMALYAFLARHNPKHYLEVGSGNSTKFARRAIADHRLQTRITSIDPHPRAEIDGICDRVIRTPVEAVALETFDILEAGDILFIDSSHRTFMNSDVTMLFLEVLPRLAPGVLVQVHDVTLPYDYPPEWSGRFYSEQYLLAAYLLAGGGALDVVLPCAFVSDDPELHGILSPIWNAKWMTGVEAWGGSFWFRPRP
jgi:hypothetical protein